MPQNSYHNTASISLSLAMTNPELIWAHQQEQKRRAGISHNSGGQPQQQPDVKSSSASTYSESTTYSYDKEKSQNDTKQKRSVKQRIKDTLKDMGSPPTSRHDRENGVQTKDQPTEHGPMSSSPLGIV